ncbi:MAG TPA: nucleoside triphosphate pyrophosphohydrolase [Candidatus Ornithospirochaeta avicola]|uniref:Nucleoside triphosphate pyrophosphohydrolase n=1 Tax=Candidatus Ornithospirochaeta avicola TaxID=2840896 RepID=A0A9D1PRA1_9SPIO|nr:nucleoside triphosphate pyrophosphohydrolase [Candidatus Ornithospirochaeta avicola]
MIDYKLNKADNISDACKNLYEIITALRSPEGCPWDRKQSEKSAAISLIDETYEYIEGCDKKDISMMREEIGDIMINLFLALYISDEKGNFSPADAINEVCEKLIRRHPHVFSDKKAENEKEVLSLWNSVKENIEGKKFEGDKIFSHIPSSLPPLERCYEIQKKMHKVGFDWPDANGALLKVKEELKEVEDAVYENNKEHIEEEIGDLLCSVVNLSRFLDVRATAALERCNRKVEKRFLSVIKKAEERGIDIMSSDLDTLDKIWDEVKAEVRAQ